MMGERQVQQDALFYEFSLERHVPGIICCGRSTARHCPGFDAAVKERNIPTLGRRLGPDSLAKETGNE